MHIRRKQNIKWRLKSLIIKGYCKGTWSAAFNLDFAEL